MANITDQFVTEWYEGNIFRLFLNTSKKRPSQIRAAMLKSAELGVFNFRSYDLSEMTASIEVDKITLKVETEMTKLGWLFTSVR